MFGRQGQDYIIKLFAYQQENKINLCSSFHNCLKAGGGIVLLSVTVWAGGGRRGKGETCDEG